jgi:hypothetical protein
MEVFMVEDDDLKPTSFSNHFSESVSFRWRKSKDFERGPDQGIARQLLQSGIVTGRESTGTSRKSTQESSYSPLLPTSDLRSYCIRCCTVKDQPWYLHH